MIMEDIGQNMGYIGGHMADMSLLCCLCPVPMSLCMSPPMSHYVPSCVPMSRDRRGNNRHRRGMADTGVPHAPHRKGHGRGHIGRNMEVSVGT